MCCGSYGNSKTLQEGTPSHHYAVFLSDLLILFPLSPGTRKMHEALAQSRLNVNKRRPLAPTLQVSHVWDTSGRWDSNTVLPKLYSGHGLQCVLLEPRWKGYTQDVFTLRVLCGHPLSIPESEPHLSASLFMCTLFTPLWLTLWDPMDYSPPGSAVHGISPEKNTRVSCHALLQQGSKARSSALQADSLYVVLIFYSPLSWNL